MKSSDERMLASIKKSILMDLKRRDREALWALFRRYGQGMSRADAEKLCGSREAGYTTAARGFGRCACNLAVAADCAARGDAIGQQIYEHCAEACLDDDYDFLVSFQLALGEMRFDDQGKGKKAS